MHIDKVKISDIVYVTDYSYSLIPIILKPSYNYIPFAREKEPYTIIEKGKFTAHTWPLKKEKFNNVRIKNNTTGEELYIKARFLRKIKKAKKEVLC